MKKTTLRQAAMKLAIVAIALFAPLGLRAQEIVTIGDGTVTINTNPIGTYYNYSITEQLYTADEIGMAGTISSISFYYMGNAAKDLPITVYMANVDAEDLSAGGISLADADQVFTGTLSVPATAGWVTIELGSPFAYDGTSNLLIGCIKDYLYYFNGQTWQGTATTSTMARYTQNDYNAYTTSTTPGTEQANRPNIQLVITPSSGGDVCDKPSTCEVSDVTSTSATLTWSGGSGTYNVEVKGGSYTDWTAVLSNTILTTTTLTLQPAASYQARVQSVCDGTTPTSGWKSVSFTTPCDSYDIPYTYDFETAAPFNCWTPIAGVTRANSSSDAHASSYYLKFSGTTSNLVALPQFNEPTNNLRVEFWTRPEGYTYSSCGTFSVGYMTDIADASTFVEVANYAYNEWTSNTHVKKTVDFNNAPANANIAFRHNAGASNYYWFADDVTVKAIPSCVAPTGLAANPSTTSAELSWTANSSETAWTVYYKKTSDENYTEVANATNPYTLNDLTAATNYQFYVVANCTADDASESSAVFPFATECEAISTFPWNENFESMTATTVPLCWDNSATTGTDYGTHPEYYWGVYGYGGNKMIRMNNYNAHGPLAIINTPTFVLPAEAKELTFDYTHNATSGTFSVKISVDGGESFTELQQYTKGSGSSQTDPGTFTEATISLADYTNQSVILQFYSAANYGNGAIFIDNIRIDNPPTCRKPSDLMLETPSARTAHTATLKWTNGEEGQTAWQIAYSTDANFAPDNDFTPNGTTEWIAVADVNPFVIEGLAQHTDYYAYVRANCGGEYSNWSTANVHFQTLQGNATPTGLAVAANTITSTEATATWNAVDGNTLHESYDIYWAVSTTEAPVTAVPAEPTEPNLISGIDGTSQLISGLNPETQYRVWVRDNCGDENNGGDGYSDWSSYVTFTTASACQTPDGLAASNVTTNSATISWNTYGQTDFNLRYSDDGENWITENNVTSPHTITALTNNTTYQVTVQATCADAETWSSVLNFTTKCEAITDFPISYGFETTEGFPANAYAPTTNQLGNCWRNQATVQTGSNSTRVWGTSTSNYHTGSQVLLLPDKGNSSNPAKTMLVFPPMNFSSSNGYHVSFWIYRNSSSSNPEGFKVYASNTDTIDANAVELGHYSRNYTIAYPVVESTPGWYNYDFYIPQTTLTGTVYLIFEGQSYYGSATYVDDITIEEAPSCFPVGTLTYDNVEATSAELSWTLVDDNQDAWVVEYATDVNFTTVLTADADSHSDFVLNGLTPATHYWVRVKADCGNDGYGEVSNVIDFTTEASCTEPTAFDIVENSLQAHQVQLSWTAGGDETAWDIYYSEENTAPVNGVTEPTIDGVTENNPYTLLGLTDARTYYVWVRAHCGDAAGQQSPWVDPVSFSTPQEAVTAPYADDFENGNNWLLVNGNLTNAWAYGEAVNNGGTHALYISNDGGATNAYNNGSAAMVYATKLITFEEGTYKFSYDWKANGESTYDYLRVALGPATTTLTAGTSVPTDFGTTTLPTGWTALDGGSKLNLKTDWQSYGSAEMPIAAGTYMMVFAWRNDNSQGTNPPAAIDNVSIEKITCIAPTALAASNVTAHAATLGWTAGADEEAWQIAYGTTADFDPDDVTPIDVTENQNPYLFGNLTQSTHYYAYVRAKCGEDDYSNWSNMTDFTTISGKQMPTGLTVTDIASATATATWTGVTTNELHESYDLYYSKLSSMPETLNEDSLFTGITATTHVFANLESEVTYYVWVRDICGTDGESDWTSTSFTTLPSCPTPTALAATNITNNAATISWTGSSDVDNYTVQYREAEGINTNGGLNENFNSLTTANSIPEGWSNDEGTTSTASHKWCYNTSTSGNGATNGTSHDDSKCVRFNSYTNSSNNTNFLQTPSMDFPAGETMMLSFWWKNPAAGDFSVYISTDGGTTKNPIAEGLTGQSTWTQATYKLTDYVGASNVTIHFKGTSNYGNGDAYIYLDDIMVGYTVPAGEWNDATEDVAAESFTIEGLEAATKYDVQVKSNCTNGEYSAPYTFTTASVFTKSIQANKWYAIATPAHDCVKPNDAVALTNVLNLTAAGHDLYSYDEANGSWMAANDSMMTGTGYIYRSAADAELGFVGYANTGSVSISVTSSSTTDPDLKGFNLIGNPYPHAVAVSRAFYTLEPNGTWMAKTSGSTIDSTEACLVYYSYANSYTTYDFSDVTPAAGAKGNSNNAALAFTVSNGEYSDVAYARFDNGEGLPKIGHLAANAPMLSIPVEGRRYAIANLGSDCQSFDMVFRGTGTYTMSFNGNTGYCHLIDRVAGKDIDMLRQNYTFSSNGFDADRFTVKLSPDAQENANGNFAYWNGNVWMVEGNGTLQVFDALGRQLLSQEISNSNFEIQNSLFPAAGVYVLRMGEKTQKIVVR